MSASVSCCHPLAYAYSVADTDHGELLSNRARWASDCLDDGDLTLGSTYIVFQLDPTTSLQRRARTGSPPDTRGAVCPA
jgi:hypothetical protein